MAGMTLSQALGRVPVEPQWLTRKEASSFLTKLGCPTTADTLARLAANDNALKGPPFTRSGRRTVRYEPDDLRAWAKAQTRRIE